MVEEETAEVEWVVEDAVDVKRVEEIARRINAKTKEKDKRSFSRLRSAGQGRDISYSQV